MTPTELLAELRSLGVTLARNGDKLRCIAPEGTITPELRGRLAEHKSALLSWIAEPAPPPDRASDEPANSDARLYPTLGQPVSTPQGRGLLWQVFDSRAGVVLNSAPKRVSFFDPAHVIPCPESPAPRR